LLEIRVILGIVVDFTIHRRSRPRRRVEEEEEEEEEEVSGDVRSRANFRILRPERLVIKCRCPFST
jgi:hypothetical protein